MKITRSRRTSGARIARVALLLAVSLAIPGCPGDEGDACRADTECGSGLFCAGPDDPPVCGIPPREECAVDADCAPGGEVCHAIGDGCSPDGLGSECGPPCTATSCAPGLRCGSGGACEPVPCDEGFACPSHLRCDPVAAHAGGAMSARTQGCAVIPCTGDTACPAGGACVDGGCQSGPGTCREEFAVP
ncbi:MAG: hypothetical protein HY907_17220 [Deltaproteobacteria bacterium]|nr:hypothetical protein [Deltaproteobacteria bacterium]